jgi:hypothetical protein
VVGFVKPTLDSADACEQAGHFELSVVGVGHMRVYLHGPP